VPSNAVAGRKPLLVIMAHDESDHRGARPDQDSLQILDRPVALDLDEADRGGRWHHAPDRDPVASAVPERLTPDVTQGPGGDRELVSDRSIGIQHPTHHVQGDSVTLEIGDIP
jgi:hypothetical protein